MGKKFLIIDDSALMRRVISDIIKQNTEYEVLDIAVDGLDGFDKLVKRPGYYDLVMLDINMPRMNGLEMLEQLQKNHMKEAVVVVSTVAKEGTREALRALELGALDFVTKPENFYEVRGEGFRDHMLSMISLVSGNDLNRNSIGDTTQVLRAATVKRIKTPVAEHTRTATPARPPASHYGAAGKKGSSKLVAIACSTGGPRSLQQVIPLLPANLDAGVVLVQHMPKGFTASLALRLDSMSKVKVKEAEDGDRIQKGQVYIAPGGRHMRVVKSASGYVIKISDEPAVEGLRPCANVMYESLCDSDYDEITCAVLTGMGADGTKGIKALHDAGKNIYVISQDAESCVVYGMPRTIAEAGLSNEVRPLSQIAESIIKNVGVS